MDTFDNTLITNDASLLGGKKGQMVLLGKKHLNQTNWRWLTLLLSCLILIGSYFCYDMPTYLNIAFQKDLNMNVEDIDLFYSCYSLPNIFLALFGGYFIDKIGIRIGLMIFLTLVVLGNLSFFISVFFKHSLNTMLIGRIIFGIGGGCLNLTSQAFISKWFFGKELSFALAFNTSFARIGSVASSYLLPPLYNINKTLTVPLLFGVLLCVASLAIGLCLCVIDRFYDTQIQQKKTRQAPRKISIADITKFKLEFWIACVSCCFGYAVLFPFIANSQAFLNARFGVCACHSSLIISTTYVVSAIFTPIVGIWIDKYGNRCLVMTISCFFGLGSYLILMLIPDCPDGSCRNFYILILPYIMLGIFDSFYSAAIWPSIALTCLPDMRGTAFGIAASLQELGLFFAPEVAGQIICRTHKSGGYYYMFVFFILCMILCILCNIILDVEDRRNDNILWKKQKDIKETTTLESSGEQNIVEE